MTEAGGQRGGRDLKDPTVRATSILRKVHLIHPLPPAPHAPVHNYY